jgi:putative transcriptional regulator
LRGAEGEWRQISPGIDVKRLVIDEHTGSKSFLLRAAPGANLPAHPHRGLEECLVLEGEFSMGELTLRAGDFHCAAGGSEHEVATTRTGVLIYLRGNIEDYAWA